LGIAPLIQNQASGSAKASPMIRAIKRWTHSQKKMNLKSARVIPAGPVTSMYCGICL
jgi:hypothetical protein